MERTKGMEGARHLLAIICASFLLFILPRSLPAGNLPLPHTIELQKVPLRMIPIADLAITDITFEAKGAGTPGLITISVKNVGKATSSKRKLSVVLMQEKGIKAKSPGASNPSRPTRR